MGPNSALALAPLWVLGTKTASLDPGMSHWEYESDNPRGPNRLSNEVGKTVWSEWGGDENPVNQDCGRVEFVGIKGSPALTVATDIIDIWNRYFRALFMHTLTRPLWRNSFGSLFIRNVYPRGKPGGQFGSLRQIQERKKKPKNANMTAPFDPLMGLLGLVFSHTLPINYMAWLDWLGWSDNPSSPLL